MGKKIKVIIGLFVSFIFLFSLGSVSIYYEGIVDEMNLDIEDYKDDIDKLNGDLDKLNEDHTSLQTDYEDLENEYDTLDYDYSDISLKYNNLLTDFQALQEDYINLESRYYDINSDINKFGLWQDHGSYYRVYFSDLYFWLYTRYSNLSYWKAKEKDTTQYYKCPIRNVDVLNQFIVYNDSNSYIDIIANQIWNRSNSEKEYAEMALEFVHELIYYMDDKRSVGKSEYWRFPDETLFDKVGDCEDTSFLYASLLRAMDIPTIIIEFENHIAVGVGIVGFTGKSYNYDGKIYFYAETTSNMFNENEESERNYKIGEIPQGLDKAYLHEVY